MKKHVILTGAHGTGKTTVLNILKQGGAAVLTEVVRDLNRNSNVPINESGTEDGQRAIFNAYVEKLRRGDEWEVSDRGLTDVLAYTLELVARGKCSIELFEQQLRTLKDFQSGYGDELLYVFFPIEFAIVKDGVRSGDEDFQKQISNNILGILHTTKIPYITVSGTPEERAKEILLRMYTASINH